MGWLSNLLGTSADLFRIGRGTIISTPLSAARDHALQDKDGTLAHLDDIPVVLDYMDPSTTTAEELIEALIANGWMEGPTPAVPVNTVLPAITGGTSVGSVLTLSDGSWTESPTSFLKQWYEDIGGTLTPLSGETGNTYTTDHAGDFYGGVIAENGVGPSEEALSAVHTVTSGTLLEFGFSNTVGPSDGFPGAANRGLASVYANKTNSGTVTTINARLRSDTIAGANGKICAFSDGGGAPGTLLWVSQPATIPAGGGVVQFDLPTSGLNNTDPAAAYYLVFVPSDFQANLAKSNVLADGILLMANGTFSYASPPSTWPGTDATYDGPACIWCEYFG